MQNNIDIVITGAEIALAESDYTFWPDIIELLKKYRNENDPDIRESLSCSIGRLMLDEVGMWQDYTELCNQIVKAVNPGLQLPNRTKKS